APTVTSSIVFTLKYVLTHELGPISILPRTSLDISVAIPTFSVSEWVTSCVTLLPALMPTPDPDLDLNPNSSSTFFVLLSDVRFVTETSLLYVFFTVYIISDVCLALGLSL